MEEGNPRSRETSARFMRPPNLRQRAALTEASQHFRSAARNAKEGLPLEIIALDLGNGLEELGEIIGETTNEEILEKIFSEFCLGK